MPELPDIGAPITRADKVTVVYTDLQGLRQTISARGLLSRAIQHETDHLNGVLLVDKMSPMQNSPWLDSSNGCRNRPNKTFNGLGCQTERKRRPLCELNVPLTAQSSKPPDSLSVFYFSSFANLT
jgi:hypothetical protein